MCQQTIYELTQCEPHVPDDMRLTAVEFALYRAGYEHALAVALEALKVTEQRFNLRERTKRLDAKRRRGGDGKRRR